MSKKFKVKREKAFSGHSNKTSHARAEIKKMVQHRYQLVMPFEITPLEREPDQTETNAKRKTVSKALGIKNGKALKEGKNNERWHTRFNRDSIQGL